MRVNPLDPCVWSNGLTDYPDLHFTLGEDVDVLLPEAESPAGGITYTLSPMPGYGLSFDSAKRKITGKPHMVRHGVLYRYTAVDIVGCSVSLAFRIFVKPTPYNVDNEAFVSLLPPNATRFEKDMEEMLWNNILPVDENMHVRMPILDAWNPDTCPAHLLPYLGINLSVDVAGVLSENQKRRLLKKSYSTHAIEGSKQSLLEVVFALGYSGAAIIENAEDAQGVQHWANYRVFLNQRIPISEAHALLDLIRELAPVWCKLVGVDVSSSGLLWDGSINFDGTHTFGSVIDSGLLS